MEEGAGSAADKGVEHLRAAVEGRAAVPLEDRAALLLVAVEGRAVVQLAVEQDKAAAVWDRELEGGHLQQSGEGMPHPKHGSRQKVINPVHFNAACLLSTSANGYPRTSLQNEYSGDSVQFLYPYTVCTELVV